MAHLTNAMVLIDERHTMKAVCCKIAGLCDQGADLMKGAIAQES